MSKEKPRQLAFIDDSGDLGLTFKKGSSSHFVLTLILFDRKEEAERVSRAIEDFKKREGFPEKVELKFTKSNKRIRKSFLEKIRKFKFVIYGLHVSKELFIEKESLHESLSYKVLVKDLIRRIISDEYDLNIKIDGYGSRQFERTFVSYLKEESKRINSQTRITLVDSKNDVLIQLADMVAGAIRISFDNERKDGLIYRDIMKSKIIAIWDFVPK
jgi:hypothetical protein